MRREAESVGSGEVGEGSSVEHGLAGRGCVGEISEVRDFVK